MANVYSDGNASAALRGFGPSTVQCRADVLEATLSLAEEIAREGTEGRHIGALFTIGQSAEVLRCSRPLILDPLKGHLPPATHITNPNLRGTVKTLAQLDGAFVVAEDGTVVSACRYLDAPRKAVRVQLGLGSRHLAAAAISQLLHILAVVVSQTGRIRVFADGELVWSPDEPAR